MNEMNLSKRLACVASYVPKASRLADIGSDHGYLPSFLYLQGVITYAIAGEVNEGPYQTARGQINRLGLTEKISVRKGDGLDVINEEDHVDVITICGMGGTLITEILERGQGKLQNVKRLILQPNVLAEKVRKWLVDHDWQLIDEQVIEEDKKIYEVLVAEPGSGTVPYEKDKMEVQLLLGPFLMKRQNEAFRKKWLSEMNQWKRIIEQFEHAEQTEEIVMKRNELLHKLKQVEGVLL